MATISTPKDRKERGKSRRGSAPRSSHADFSPPADRPDPVHLIIEQDAGRLDWLVPVRHGRMSASAFTFYRGAARIMVADLADTPDSGLPTQLCGDAHLSNFGSYASPDRRQVFDVNDFDETLPGPWEWDLKRLATSIVVAGRDRGFNENETRRSARRSVTVYRKAMADFAAAPILETWYSQLSLDQLAAALSTKKQRASAAKRLSKARTKNSLHALSKFAEPTADGHRIKSDFPIVVPLRDIATAADRDRLTMAVDKALESYRATLRHDRRLLFDKYRPVDIALKVVGVGSVGTRCMIVLFEGRDGGDPLFLQIKEATTSVLEDHLTHSTYQLHGRRVVEGQRVMQASSDIFLGWSASNDGTHYYWRQLRDMKGSADIDAMGPRRLTDYGGLCGWTLAHAHARAGDPIAIAGYIGSGEVFDRAIEQFAVSYADQNDRDYDAYMAAIRAGRIETTDG